MSNKFEVGVRRNGENHVIYEGSAEEVVSWIDRNKDQEFAEFIEIFSVLTNGWMSVSDFLVMNNKAASKTIDWETLNKIGKVPPKTEPIIPKEVEQMVPKYYRMNPETEDLLKSGRGLRNGMVVLVADPEGRRFVDNLSDDGLFYSLLEFNRWCTVTQLSLGTFADGTSNVSFVAVYENGEKRRRDYDAKVPWLVKKDTVWDDENEKGRLIGVCVEFLTGILDRHKMIIRNGGDGIHADQTAFLRDRAFAMVQMLRAGTITPRELTNEEKYKKVWSTVDDMLKRFQRDGKLDPNHDRIVTDVTEIIISTLIQ